MRIALIGANEQQNPLILKARELGYETHVFAWQTGSEIGAHTADVYYPISAVNMDAILEKCREIGICAIASIGSDVAAVSCAYVSEQMGFPTSGFKAVKVATNKLLTRAAFAGASLPQPEYVEISDTFDAAKLAAMPFPLVVKPSDRSGARGLCKVYNKRQLYRAINRARETSFEGRAIAERYIKGQYYSCECMSFNGMHTILGYTRREIRELDGAFIETAHVQPGGLPCSVRRSLEDDIPRVLDALEIRYGASSIEFIVDEEKNYWFIEVSPTMYGDFIGSHLIPIATGADYLKMVLDTALGKQPEPTEAKLCNHAEIRFICERKDADLYNESLMKAENISVLEVFDDAEISDTFEGVRCGCYATWRRIRAFGGCNPLELPLDRSADLRFGKENSVALNSEYTAFWYALKSAGSKTVFMPCYTAGAWARAIDDSEIEIRYYHINADFSPCFDELDGLGEGCSVLLADFFGICGHRIPEWTAQIERRSSGKATIIIDNSMAYFSEPVLAENIYNIYSCRKFFGVPDGAYLVSPALAEAHVPQLERNVAHSAASAQLIALELGEGAAYKTMQTNEQELIRQRKHMSALSEAVLLAADKERIRLKRLENYRILHQNLLSCQKLQCVQGLDETASPQCYPLLVEANIRDGLIAEKIFVPLMWRRHLNGEFEGTTEQNMAKYLLCLPIDQRYSTSDMQYIADTVKMLLN